MNHAKNPRYFRGLIYEIRFWNYARSKVEINRDRNRPIDPKSEGLVACYDFNRIDEKPDTEKEPGANFYFAPMVREALKLPAYASRTND